MGPKLTNKQIVDALKNKLPSIIHEELNRALIVIQTNFSILLDNTLKEMEKAHQEPEESK